jgi:16S rRNA G966 N2-methylase RsmD
MEGLSRGCSVAHFVEMDNWVISKCLNPNLRSTGLVNRAAVHCMKVEDFLRRALAVPSFAGGPFDFVSITPPYMLVSYTEIYDLLDNSSLIHPRSVVIVEYAKQNIPEIRNIVGPLQLVKSRRYGRTNLAIYAASQDL